MPTFPAAGDRLNALTKPGGITEAHSRWHGRTMEMQENVKHYGAVGDGVADDTTAITNTITAAYADGGSVFLPAPSNYYRVTSTINLSQMPGLHLVGGGSKQSPTQFNRAPRVPIIGPSSLIPAFQISATLSADSDGVTFENLDIHAGCPLRIRNANMFVARNCAFQALSTTDADGAGVVVENGFWHFYRDCVFFAPSSTLGKYGVILRGKTSALTSNTCYLMRWEDCNFGWGGVQYSQVNASGSTEGRLWFDGCTSEGLATGSALLDYTSNGQTRSLANINMKNCETADSGGANPLIRVACGGGGLVESRVENCSGHNRIVEVSNANVFYSSFEQCGDMFPVVDSAGAQYPYGGQNFQTGKHDGIHIYGATASGLPPTLFLQNETGPAADLYSDTSGVLKTNANVALTGAGKYQEFLENGTTDATAGAANTGRLFVKDNGAGKTQLCVRFNTGAVQVIATEP